MNCRRCKGEMDPGDESGLCDECYRCLDCGKTAWEEDIEKGLCPDCWAAGKREEMLVDRRREC